MPVTLKASDYERQVDTSDQEQPSIDLLRLSDAEKMIAWQVDPRVGNIRNNEPSLNAIQGKDKQLGHSN